MEQTDEVVVFAAIAVVEMNVFVFEVWVEAEEEQLLLERHVRISQY